MKCRGVKYCGKYNKDVLIRAVVMCRYQEDDNLLQSVYILYQLVYICK